MVDKPELPLNRYGSHRGMHPNSRKNIRPAGESQSLRFGPVTSIVGLLRQELAKIPELGLDGEPNKEKLTNARLIVERIMREAIGGNVSLAREILDRIDGRPVQAISGPQGSPIQVQQSLRLGPVEISAALETLLLHGVIQVEGEDYPRLEEGRSGDNGERGSEEASG